MSRSSRNGGLCRMALRPGPGLALELRLAQEPVPGRPAEWLQAAAPQ